MIEPEETRCGKVIPCGGRKLRPAIGRRRRGARTRARFPTPPSSRGSSRKTNLCQIIVLLVCVHCLELVGRSAHPTPTMRGDVAGNSNVITARLRGLEGLNGGLEGGENSIVPNGLHCASAFEQGKHFGTDIGETQLDAALAQVMRQRL